MKDKEIVTVKTRQVRCEGSGGSLGHPAVYLTLERDDQVVCPYCSRTFVLEPGAKAESH